MVGAYITNAVLSFFMDRILSISFFQSFQKTRNNEISSALPISPIVEISIIFFLLNSFESSNKFFKLPRSSPCAKIAIFLLAKPFPSLIRTGNIPESIPHINEITKITAMIVCKYPNTSRKSKICLIKFINHLFFHLEILAQFVEQCNGCSCSFFRILVKCCYSIKRIMIMKKTLNPTQQEILSLLIDNIGYPFTIREIQKDLELSSTSVVSFHLKQLEKKGYIKRNPLDPRDYQIYIDGPEKKIAYLNLYGLAQCGPKGLFLDDTPIDTIPISTKVLSFPSQEAFLVEAKGDSMNPKIQEGDYVIVRKTSEIDNGKNYCLCK